MGLSHFPASQTVLLPNRCLYDPTSTAEDVSASYLAALHRRSDKNRLDSYTRHVDGSLGSQPNL
jgi:hypothetical protein